MGFSSDSFNQFVDNITPLSQNEARVLHSIIKWPDLSDQAIHSQIGMKKSTFSSIKARLREQDYFRKYNIPNFPKLGFEILAVMHGNLNRFTTFDERMRVAGDVIKSFVEDFYVVSESNKAFNLSISQNLTEYLKNQEKFFQVYSENKFLNREGMSTSYFPFEISRVRAFMDFEPLISKLFGFASEPYVNELTIPSQKVKSVKLSKAERKVLVGLVNFPEESDTLIAEKVGVSRNTVANAKRKFFKEKILFSKIVPNLEKLGLKLTVYSHRKFNPKTTMSMREEAAELVKKELAPFFYVSNDLEGFIISAHANFEEYNKAQDEVMKFYMKNDYITEEPVTYQISIPNQNIIKDYTFLEIVLKRLGFDPKGTIEQISVL